MDFQFTTETKVFRQEVRDLLRETLPHRWRGRIGVEFARDDETWAVHRRVKQELADRGWLALGWPKEHGGQGASQIKQTVFTEEMASHYAPGWDIFGVRMLGPVLMRFGTTEQQQRFLPSIAQGTTEWCQGYSEPGTGSDLASLQMRAVEDGDDFVLNGTKTWTTQGHRSDWMFVLARTDPGAPKHKGISFLLCPLSNQGVTIRSLESISGGHVFSQVIFDNVRIPQANLVGEKNKGWYVAMSLLDFERSAVEFSAWARSLTEEVAALISESNCGHIRQGYRYALADRFIESQVGLLMSYQVASMQDQGKVPSREASFVKLFGSEVVQRATQTAMRVLGIPGQLTEGDVRAPLNGRALAGYLDTISHTIFSGSSEIQRNIISTRGLGLPRR